MSLNNSLDTHYTFHSHAFSAAEINQLARRRDRATLRLVFDVGDETHLSMMRYAASKGLRRFGVYVGGPVGPTDGKWDDYGKGYAIKGARAVGLQIPGDGLHKCLNGRVVRDSHGHKIPLSDKEFEAQPWMQQWTEQGWKQYAVKQMKGFTREVGRLGLGLSQAEQPIAEIDNLNRAAEMAPQAKCQSDETARYQASIQPHIELYAEFASMAAKGIIPRVTLKNVSVGIDPATEKVDDRLASEFAAAVQSGRVPVSGLSGWQVSEKDPQDPSRVVSKVQWAALQKKTLEHEQHILGKVGIHTMGSWDTNRYAANSELPANVKSVRLAMLAVPSSRHEANPTPPAPTTTVAWLEPHDLKTPPQKNNQPRFAN